MVWFSGHGDMQSKVAHGDLGGPSQASMTGIWVGEAVAKAGWVQEQNWGGFQCHLPAPSLPQASFQQWDVALEAAWWPCQGAQGGELSQEGWDIFSVAGTPQGDPPQPQPCCGAVDHTLFPWQCLLARMSVYDSALCALLPLTYHCTGIGHSACENNRFLHSQGDSQNTTGTCWGIEE